MDISLFSLDLYMLTVQREPMHTCRQVPSYYMSHNLLAHKTSITRFSLIRTRVSDEISTDMNNRMHYNSDWERYRLIYVTRK